MYTHLWLTGCGPGAVGLDQLRLRREQGPTPALAAAACTPPEPWKKQQRPSGCTGVCLHVPGETEPVWKWSFHRQIPHTCEWQQSRVIGGRQQANGHPGAGPTHTVVLTGWNGVPTGNRCPHGTPSPSWPTKEPSATRLATVAQTSAVLGAFRPLISCTQGQAST